MFKGMKTKFIALAITASQLHLCAGSDRPDNYTAHEWGTFTSVQGADGQLIQWHPLSSSKLPTFVYDRNKPSGHPRLRYASGKDDYSALQRMETPVIYFYSDRERKLDVTVRFPKGLITEWYPWAEGLGPSWVQPLPVLSKLDSAVRQTGVEPGFSFTALDLTKGLRESLIRWPTIRIVPSEESGPLNRLLPAEASGSHYYAARATDANLIQVNATTSGQSKVEYEKYLFYRGLGAFNTPLEVTLSEGDESSLTLHNQGPGDLARLFVLAVRGNQANFTTSESLSAGKERKVRLAASNQFQPVATVIEQLSTQMRQALEQEGLYPREAAAMVQTWRDSWFEEQGLRVLYLLPRSWTDQVLPLSIVPTPRELVRVMVGRAEVITPRVEDEVRKQIVEFNRSDSEAKPEAVEHFRDLGLGRFAEPAIRLSLGSSPSRELSDAGWELLSASQKPRKSLAQQ
jgi:hypothetical protein